MPLHSRETLASELSAFRSVLALACAACPGIVHLMRECLSNSDLLELSQGSLAAFEQRLATIPKDLSAPFHEEARQLETELLTVYRVVVLCTKREDDLDRVGKWWETVVRVCDDFAVRLSKLVEAHPSCGADQYYDRVLELRSKCLRLQKMHR